MSNEKGKELAERDEKIKSLKVKVFDIIREQEVLNQQVGQLQETKSKILQEMLKLEKASKNKN